MHRLVAIASIVAALVLSAAAPSQAAYRPKYDQQAKAVAKAIGCKNVRLASGASGTTKSSLVCNLRGKRVNIITFKNERQQIQWLDLVDLAFPDGGYVGVARGVVAVAKNGNRAAASSGARALGGAVVPVGL
ncbi:hypothetical protein ACFJIY_00445 [Pimelobacter simplex]|uniref:hypothetical protein n=1 Tax=Nocardioides simplex TaxID=2045 RepID=UPI00366B28C8